MSTSISISASAAAAQTHTHARVHYGVSPATCVAMVHVRDSHSSYVAFASVDAVQLFRIGPAFDHVQSLRPPPSFAAFDSAAPTLHVSALAGHASNGNIAVALSDGRLLVYSPEYSLPIGAGTGSIPGVSSWALSYQSTLARPATSLAWTKETLLIGDTHSIAAYSSTTNWSQTWSIKCAPDAPIIVLAPSPDNHCLATTSIDDCLVKVWTSSTGGPITSAPPRAHSFFYLPHPQPVTSVSWRRTKSQRVLLTNCADGVARIWKWSAKLKLFLLTVAIDPQTVMDDVGLAPSSCFWLGAEAIAPHPQSSVYLSNSASERVARTDPELAELVTEYDELVMSGESNGTVLVWGIRNLSRQTGDTSAALIKVVSNCFRAEHFATLACPHTVQFAFNTSLEHLLLLGASAQGTLSCLSVNIGHLVYRPYTKMRLVRQWSGHTLAGSRPTAYGVGKWLVTQVGPEALVWDPANRHSGLRQVNGLRLKSRCMLYGEEEQDKQSRLWYLPLDGKTDCVAVSRSQVQCGSFRFQFDKTHGVPLDACIVPAGPGSEAQQRLSIICSSGLVILLLPALDLIPTQATSPSTIDHAALFSASDRYHAVLLAGASLRLIDSSGSTLFHDPKFSLPANILQLLAANHTLVLRTADAVHVYTIGLVHHAVTLERTLPIRANHASIFPLPTGGVVLAIGRDHHVQVFARRVGLASPSSVLDHMPGARDEPVTPSQPTGLLPTLAATAATPATSAAGKPEPIPVMDLAALEWYTLTTVSLSGFVDAVAWTSQGDLVALVAHTLVVLDPIPTLVQEALDAQSPALDSGSVLREWLRWNRPEVVRAILNHVYYARRAGVDRTPVVPWEVVEEAAGIKSMKGAAGEGGGSGDGLSLATKTAGDELDALFAAGAGSEMLDMDLIDTKRFNHEKVKALREILEQALASAASATAATTAAASTAVTSINGSAGHHPVSAAVIRDTQLLAVLDAISEPESASMDENGQRFRWDVLLYMHSTKRNLPTPPLSPESQAFAFFSDDQPALVDYILNACTITWETATALGAGWWLTHPDALRTMAEAIARNHWRKASNPHDCFLYYLALGKRKLMLTLWKQANGHAEQQVMMQFLAKDVNDAWKKQALKNAFVLLGKQRFELAACFFLLGEAYGDAITVCIRNLKDPQLALFVAKLVGQPGVGAVVDQIRASGSGVIESHACFGMMADWMAGSRMVDMAKVASPATYLLVQSMERKLQVQYLASAGITPQERREAVGRAVAWYHERGAPYFTRLMVATLPAANGGASGANGVVAQDAQPELDDFAAMFGGGGLSDGPPQVADAGGADDFEAMFGASISDGPPKRSNGGGGDDFDALFGAPNPKPSADSDGAGGGGGDAFDALFGDPSASKPVDDDSATPGTGTSAPASVPVELLTAEEQSMIVQADHLSTLWQVAKSIFVVQATPLAHDLQFDDYAKMILRQIHSGPDSPAHIDSLLDLLCWLTLSPNSAFYVCKKLNVDLFLSLNLRILVHMLGRTGPEDLDENQRSMFLVLLLHCLHTLGDSALIDPTAPASAAPHSAIVTTLFLLVHVLASRGLYRALGALVRHLPAVITPLSPGLALSSPPSSPLVLLRAMHSEMQPHLSDLPSSRHLVLEYLTLRMFQDWMYAVIVEFQQGMSSDEVFVVADVCVPHLTARLRWIHDEVHRTETLVQSPAEDWLPSAHQELFEALNWSPVWLDELRVPRISLKELPVAGPGAALPTVTAAAPSGAATADAAIAAKSMPLEEGFLRLAAFNTAQAAESAARASADPSANPTGLRTIVTPADPPFVPKIDTVFKHDAIINGMSLHPSSANLIVAQAKAVIELNVERAHRTMQRVLSGGPGLQPPSQSLPPGSAASNAPPPLIPNLSSTSLSAMGAHTAVIHDPYAGSPPAVLTRTSSTAAADDPTTLISPALSNRSAVTTTSTISGIGADFMKKARQAVDSTLGTGATMPASGIANEFGIVDFLPTSHAQVASHSALDYYVLADWIENNTILSLRQYGGRGDLLRIPYGAAKVNKLEIDSVGGRLAVADTVGDVAIFGLPSMRIFSSFPCHSRFTSDVVFHGSSTLLVSAGSSPGHTNNVALWDTLLPVHSARVRGYNIHESGATAVAYDGRLVYSGGKKGDMHVLDTRHSRPLLSLQAHGSTIASLAVSPNSSLLYSGSIDGTLKVWDMSTSSPTEIATFKHMHGTRKFLSVSSAATLPVSSLGITKILAGDGFVLTCGADGAVKWLH